MDTPDIVAPEAASETGEGTIARKHQGTYPSAVLALGIFLMGGIGLAYEYTFSKLASDLLGNSARQWAIVIAVMMLFMGIGADIQKYFRNDNLVDKLIMSEILLGLLGGAGPIVLLSAFGAAPDYFTVFEYMFVCGVGLLIGFEIPLVTRINEGYAKNLQYNLARVLKMDYLGAVCGALVWIFVLPKFFTLIEGALVLGMVSMGVAALTLFCFRDRVAYRKSLLTAIVVCAACSAVSITMVEGWTVHAEQRLFRDRILFSETSKFQHLVVTQSRTGTIKCYLNGYIQFSSDDEHIYHENLVHPAMSIAPRRESVLILGGGDGLALREVLKYPDVESVVLVDIDPMMTRVASENPIFKVLNHGSLTRARTTVLASRAVSAGGPLEVYAPFRRSGRFREEAKVADVQVMNIDAARFVEDAEGRFDVILLDFPDPNSLELAPLYSEQFYRVLGTKLAADGILALQSTSPYHAKEAFLCIGRTLRASGFSVVPYHDNVPTFGEWGWWIGGHDYVYGPEKIRSRLEGVDSLHVDTEYLNPELIGASLVFGTNYFDFEPDDISTLSSPRVYSYYLMGWATEF